MFLIVFYTNQSLGNNMFQPDKKDLVLILYFKTRSTIYF